VLAVVDGYCQHRRLTPAELAWLPAAIRFMTLVLLAACFPDRVNGTLGEDDLLYGATYGAWQAQYTATDQIAALARFRFERDGSAASFKPAGSV
jgi:Ser/Thr protein kinase RdoA (MazF antagonist)